jgi:hypothetical protein
MREYERAADAFRAAISVNPNFPEAHVRLAALLEKHLGDPRAARAHRRLASRMRRRKSMPPMSMPAPEKVGNEEFGDATFTGPAADTASLAKALIVVTGLPRSGTSMLMQMLAAGGMHILTDGLRRADKDNPMGYLEFEPVKNLLKDSKWLMEGRGQAVKIVAPLLAGLPPGLACRVILCERDLDEVLDSQERMLARRNQPISRTAARRQMLKEEYARMLRRVKAMLARRPDTQLLVIEHGHTISAPAITARKVNEFLGGGLDVPKMAAAIDPKLHRTVTAARPTASPRMHTRSNRK